MKIFRGKFNLFILLLSCFFLLISPKLSTARSSWSFPKTIDLSDKYFFYLHGMIIEMRGPHAQHPEYGTYDYYGILKTFKKHGFSVISDVRRKGTNSEKYAETVVEQIRTLLDAGVPPEKITVAGFSKGGLIALYVSAKLKNPKVNFVVMAGCSKEGTKFRKEYDMFLKQAAPSMQGRFLSIYDASDKNFGTCHMAIDAASDITKTTEVEVEKGLDHGLFYKPREEWVEPVVNWISSD